jgi:hypothetical protein
MDEAALNTALSGMLEPSGWAKYYNGGEIPFNAEDIKIIFKAGQDAALARAPLPAQGEPIAKISESELRDVQSGRMGVPIRSTGWRKDQTIPLYLAAPAQADDARDAVIRTTPGMEYSLPFKRATDPRTDVVSICDADGYCVFDLNTHTQRALTDLVGLVQDREAWEQFADFIVRAVNRAAMSASQGETGEVK